MSRTVFEKVRGVITDSSNVTTLLFTHLSHALPEKTMIECGSTKRSTKPILAYFNTIINNNILLKATTATTLGHMLKQIDAGTIEVNQEVYSPHLLTTGCFIKGFLYATPNL